MTARHQLLGEQFLRGTVYASDQTHHSVEKAAVLAGIPASNVRPVPSDHQFRMQLPALEERIGGDRRAGFQPFLIVGNAGTTNTGAVDDLDGLADLATRERLWLHVDAAHGGAAAFSPRYRHLVDGLSRADRLICDAPKMLFVPALCAFVFYRDPAHRFATFQQDAPYLFDPSAPGLVKAMPRATSTISRGSSSAVNSLTPRTLPSQVVP